MNHLVHLIGELGREGTVLALLDPHIESRVRLSIEGGATNNNNNNNNTNEFSVPREQKDEQAYIRAHIS